MTRDDIKESIFKKLDELTPLNGELILSIQNELSNPIEEYINEFLQDGCDRTLRAAPYHVLPLTPIPPTGIKAIINGVLLIELPDSALRIGLVDFKSWERPVMHTITVDHPNYIIQKNKFTRGGNSKPVVVWLQKAGKKYIECYTVTAGEQDQNPELTCVVSKLPEDMPEVLIPALTWLVASDVLKVIEKQKESELAFSSYTTSLLNL